MSKDQRGLEHKDKPAETSGGNMVSPMFTQASCMDCGYKHRPSQCYNRQGRIDRLREQIREKQAELAALEEYDRRIASGWEEHESSFERWKRLHAEPLS